MRNKRRSRNKREPIQLFSIIIVEIPPISALAQCESDVTNFHTYFHRPFLIQLESLHVHAPCSRVRMHPQRQKPQHITRLACHTSTCRGSPSSFDYRTAIVACFPRPGSVLRSAEKEEEGRTRGESSGVAERVGFSHPLTFCAGNWFADHNE